MKRSLSTQAIRGARSVVMISISESCDLSTQAIRGARSIFASETKGMSLQDPRTFDDVMRGSESATGRRIDVADAVGLAPVYQAVSILAGDVGSLPRYVYRRTSGDDREYDGNHPVNRLLAQPNPYQTSVRLFRQWMTHALLWGNGYLYIDRAQLGNRLGLYCLLPDRTIAEWVGGQLVYTTEVQRGGTASRVRLNHQDVIHLQGLSLDGTSGANLVRLARDSWGLALENIGFASRFYRRGGRTGGILELPPTFNKGPADKLEQGFRDKYESPDKAFSTIVLREGAKFHSAQMSPEQTQMVESREADARATARFFCMPPSKLGIQGSVSYNSLEHEQRAYLTGTLWRWLTLIESELMFRLMPEDVVSGERYIEHNVSKLIEADSKTLNETLEIQRRNEVISANEWRRKLNMNKRDDPAGDAYQNPNTKSGGQSQSKPPIGPPSDAVRAAAFGVFDSTAARIVNRVGKHVRRAAKRPAELQEWIDGNGEDYREVAAQELTAVCDMLAAVTGDVFGPRAEADRIVGEIVAAVAPLLDPPNKASELTANIERVLAKIEAQHAKGER